MASVPRRSPLALIVLLLLSEGPKHVYRMQKLLVSQGKNRVINVRSRASLYQAVERLMRFDLVEVRETTRTPGRPDRVVYAITDAGRETARVWLRQMLRSVGDEFPEFTAAVSVVFALSPEDAGRQLRVRTEKLEAALVDTQAVLDDHVNLPRLYLLEEEYRRAMLAAELAWASALVEDLETGRLTWDDESLRETASRFNPPEHEGERDE